MNEDISKSKELTSSDQKQMPETGPISQWLTSKGLTNTNREKDHLGIEIIEVTPDSIFSIVLALKDDGFNYLQCQGGYDEGPGLNLVSFYNLIEINEIETNKKTREVRLKIFLPRDGDLKVPSLYSIFRGSDWQERETYDMFGINFSDHPHPKRLLMPEDWKGWPLRKDYVQPDFYEMQDAY